MKDQEIIIEDIKPCTPDEYWKKRGEYIETSPNPISPKELWELACEYFAECDSIPMTVKELIKNGQRAGMSLELTKSKTYQWKGLEEFLTYKIGIGMSRLLKAFRANEFSKYESYQEVIDTIDSIIYRHKYERALIGEYNASMVMRDLGMSEKTDINIPKYQPLFAPTEKKDEKAKE